MSVRCLNFNIFYLRTLFCAVRTNWGSSVVLPLEDFRKVEATEQNLEWGCTELPCIVYSGTHSDFRIDAKVQTVYKVGSTVQNDDNNFFFGNSTSYFDTTPKPNAEFTWGARTQSESLTHLGTAEDRKKIEELGLSVAPVYSGEKRPDDLTAAIGYDSGGGSLNGESWGSYRTVPGWGPTIEINSGGGETFDPQKDVVLPEYYAADLYINNELAAQLDLHLQEGVEE